MFRKPSGNDVDRVDADILAIASKARRQLFSSSGNPTKTIVVERMSRSLFVRALLHFYKCHCSASLGDEVYLTACCSHAGGEDRPTLEAQIPSREGFGTAAASFGFLACQRWPASSSALE